MAVKKTESIASMTLSIPVSEIVADDKWNVRRIIDQDEYESEIKKLAASIKANGQDTAVTVKRIAGGKFQLLAGFRRYHAIKDVLQAPTIVARIGSSATTELEDMFTNLRENVARKNLTTYDLAVRCALLAGKPYKLDPKEIARSLSAGVDESQGKEVSAQYVNNLIRHASKLRPEILDMWGKGAVPFNTLNQDGVAAMSKDEQAEWLDVFTGKTEEGEPGKRGTKDGKSKGKRAKVKAIHPRFMQAAVKALANSRAGESYKEGVWAALMFCMGKKPNIPNVYDPKAEEEAAAKAKAEEKEAAKAEKEAAKAAKASANA